MKSKVLCTLVLALSAWTVDASATKVNVSMVVTQAGGLSWIEDMTSLEQQLEAEGFGNPDMYYSVSAINNSLQTRTYTFSVGSAITPTVSGPNAIDAYIYGTLGGSKGALKSIAPVRDSGIQRVELSSDNGISFVNAGVDTGFAQSTSALYGSYNISIANNPTGPSGQVWNYMRLVSEFTLSSKTTAALTGYASVTAVPEPEQAGLMLAGLALLASVVRFRRKSAVAQA